ncbi:histidine phosphatase family protein [Amycolatopsis sp. NPDC059657]|uniref:histidine phosphatase family protein n=1 Tax=Amycolatopsis sp. NPDC059657 TaxID=3346899 RepID=UPI0036703C55
MAIYFVRHGESVANEQNLFAGTQNTPLTELGVRQAHQAGKRVAALGVRFDEVHVSTLDRAGDTAAIIAGELATRPGETVVSGELVERDFGVFTARNKSLIKKSVGFRAYTEYFHSHTGCPPGGESWARMYERVRDYYESVLRPLSEAGHNVLVVTHKYVVEMFALVVSGMPPEKYRDLKIPNARPLSEADLRRICAAPAASAAVHDFGEIVEIRLPVLVAGSAVFGVLAQLTLRVPVPPVVFSVVLTALLAVSTFFGMLRVHSGVARGLGHSLRVMLPLTLVRLIAGLALIWSSASVPLVLLGLFLLLPPALLTPALSLLWDGDYFTCVRQAIAASVVLPVVLLAAAWWLPDRFGAVGPALAGYAGVLLGAMVLPAVLAQGLRRRDPIRAGQLSTNWNWLGGLSLMPLAAFATFALSPATGFSGLASSAELAGLAGLAEDAVAVVAVLVAVRLAVLGFSRWRALGPRVARDLFITQSTPNIFLWFALAGGLLHATSGYLTLLAPTVACGFFLAMYADELIFVRKHTRDLKLAVTSTGNPTLRLAMA